MASNNTVDVKIQADTSGLSSGLNTAKSEVQNAVGGMQGAFDGLNGTLAKVSAAFLAFEGVKIIANAFDNIINSVANFSNEVAHVSEVMGMSSKEASILDIALHHIGSSLESYTGAYEHFIRQLKANPDLLKSIGVDSSGSAQQAFQSAINIISEYKTGIYQSEMAMTLFGRSIDEVINLQRLNNEVMTEAKQRAEDWGLTVSDQDINASRDWQAAQAELKDELLAFEKVIASDLLPILTDLIKSFGEDMPGALEALRTALAPVIALMDGAIFVAKSLADVLGGVLATGALTATNSFQALGAALHGDFGGALQSIKSIGSETGDVWKNVTKDIGDNTQATFNRITDMTNKLIGQQQQSKSFAPAGGTKTFDSEGAKKAAAGDISQFEDELLAQKVAYARQESEAGNHHIKMQELEKNYWKNILATDDLTDKQRIAVTKKYNEAEISDLTTHGADLGKAQDIINKSIAENAAKDAQHNLNIKKIQLEQQFNLGQISKTQELQALQKFEDQSYQIKVDALQRELALADQDPENPQNRQRILDQLLDLQRKHEEDVLKLKTESAQEEQKYTVEAQKNIENSFADTISSLISGQKSLKDSLLDFINSIEQALAQAAAKNLAAQLFGGGGSGGGFLSSILGGGGGGGGFLSGIFGGGGLPSFDVGTNYVPNDMIAQVHKGEAIVPASQNRGTKYAAGGVTVNMTVNTPDSNSFRQSSGQIAASLQQTLQTAVKRNK